MMAVGQYVWVHGKAQVPGVIGRKPIYLMSHDDRNKVPELSDLWIDIGATSKADALDKIALGDPITYMSELQSLMGDRAAARGFDNKAGAFVVAEALRLLKRGRRFTQRVGVYATGTVQEEVRGEEPRRQPLQPMRNRASQQTLALRPTIQELQRKSGAKRTSERDRSLLAAPTSTRSCSNCFAMRARKRTFLSKLKLKAGRRAPTRKPCRSVGLEWQRAQSAFLWLHAGLRHANCYH